MGNDKNDEVSGILRTAQIIISALVGGVVMFGMIVLFMLGDGAQDGAAITSIVMAIFCIPCVLARLLVPGMVVSSACQKIARGTWQPSGRQVGWTPPETDEGKLAQVFLTKTIIGGAVLEGAVFGNLVAYMLEGQLYSIVLAVIMTAGILAGFPTRSGFDTWLERHLRIVNEIRTMPGNK